MAKLNGYNGSVKAGSTPSTVGEVKSFNIDRTSDVQDVTVLGSAWAANASTIKRWSGSLTAHFDIVDGGQDELRTGISDGSAVDLVLYIGGESGSGNVSYSGSAIIESISITNDATGIVEASISFTGTGELSETALS